VALVDHSVRGFTRGVVWVAAASFLGGVVRQFPHVHFADAFRVEGIGVVTFALIGGGVQK